MMLSEHTYKQFDAELEAVRANVLKMGGLVEEQIVNAVEALVKGDLDLADRVEANDHNVNALEVAVDEDCANIVARRQPTASDLRMVMMVVKTITDLERIGDEVEKVARIVVNFVTTGSPKSYYVGVLAMGHHVKRMLRAALDAFARMDSEAAFKIAQEDREVDAETDAIMRYLITYMMEDPRSITRVLDAVLSVRAFERIGDHARNICENVIYLVEGKDVRHVALEQVEQELRREGSE